MKNKISFVFFGSGPVAAESLRLLMNDFEIEAIITKFTTKSEMEKIANGTPVLCVTDKKELSELIVAQKFKSKIGVLIDFGIIVGQDVIDYFELGIVNSHFSLLPRLRGADPISFAILEGHKTTGVSLMMLVQAMDEGPLLVTKEIEVTDTDDANTLSTKLIQLSYDLLAENLPKYVSGDTKPEPQDAKTTTPTYTRKLTKQDGVIDWSKDALTIEREIRAYIEWPKSRTMLGNMDVVITKAHSVPSNSPELKPGDVQIISDVNLLTVETKNGYLCIERLKPIGKNEMDSKSFINGYKDRILIKN
jgi:methionyl-tRNA formyltransferase